MANHDSGYSRSDVMYPAVVTNGDASGSMVPVPQYAPPAIPAFGGYAPRGPEILHGGFNQTWFIHCLRRQWLPAVLLGSLAAAFLGGVLLWLFPLSNSTTAYLRVETLDQENLALFNKTERVNPKEYEIFQQTQLTLMKSTFVLNSALTRTEISQLDAVQKEGDDALAWLTAELRVSFPNEGEIMEVRFDGAENPEDIQKVVDAVIDSYQQEVTYKERSRASETRESLSKLHKQLGAELQEKVEKFQKLSKELDSADTPSASAMMGMLTNDIRMIQQQIIEKKKELVELEVMKTLSLQQANSSSALENAIQGEMAQDPMFQSFQQEQYTITQQITQMQSITKRKNSPEVKRAQEHLATLQQQIEHYRLTKEAELRKRLKSLPNDSLQQALSEYILRRRSTEADLTELQSQYEEKLVELQNKGQTSGTLSLLQSEIEQLTEVTRSMELKLRGFTVEEKAGRDRVRILQQATSQPQINVLERYLISALGALTAFGAMCYCVALLEFRRRRLNGPTDVDEGLGIRVLGVLPSISSRRSLGPGSAIAAQLSESIDGVRATLMHDSTSQPRQVVLITSPATMEGCTTVASHLALSLTRAGRRTLLIDGDLREPALHKLFGMPVEDGMCEVLRSEIDVADAIRPTNTEGLWLMTAGQCDMDAIHALATDQLQPVFEKLRAEFDFVIIDGAPILGLSDSISMGQHADGAILTLLRDHSEIRKVVQSTELLKSMGIRLIGTVVNGVNQKADRRVARLHRAAARPPRQLPSGTEG